jgi:glutamate N-acetyltransferase/amino-acid N-acetyltransferase
MNTNFIHEGSVTDVQGFEAGATYAGMKTYAKDKYDLGILWSKQVCVSAGVFTTNKIISPSTSVSRDNVHKGNVQAVTVNSGIANAGVGNAGKLDAEEVVELTASKLGIEPNNVAFLSTGIIGVELPMALIRTALQKIDFQPKSGQMYAKSMMTTDTKPKECAVKVSTNGREFTIGGVCKGTGMIHPNMATMLAVVTTDAPIDQKLLQDIVKYTADESFNMISVDGDMSTNDSYIILSNGAAGGKTITYESPEQEDIKNGIKEVVLFLAKEMVRDGEGATKLFQVTIENAISIEEARDAARTISSSSLVKTAVHGNDPNWGRLLASLGSSKAEIDESKLSVYINDICILENGLRIHYFKDAIVQQMIESEITFRINLNLGESTASAWGCNLSEEYVRFNSAYTT